MGLSTFSTSIKNYAAELVFGLFLTIESVCFESMIEDIIGRIHEIINWNGSGAIWSSRKHEARTLRNLKKTKVFYPLLTLGKAATQTFNNTRSLSL